MARKSVGAMKNTIKKPSLKTGKRITIDFPKEREIVRPGHYSIRLTAPAAAQAQVRFEGGEWLDCREALGHFWRDWAPQAGRFCVQARARAGRGRWSSIAEREVVVTAEGPERDGSIFA